MKVIVEKNYDDMSRIAASIVKEKIDEKPNTILGLATGSTPVGMYKELIQFYRDGKLDFSNVTTFNLDEYIGIGKEHPNSYHYFMKYNLFNHINIPMKNVFIPDGNAKDLEGYCKAYDRLIEKKGGIDLQILGIGANGHIAFNEPNKNLNVGTSIVKLTKSTIDANSRFFDSIDEVPKKAITMGIGSIMKAKSIMLLASGTNKSKAIRRLLDEQKITTDLPASMLHLHPNVLVIVDEDAYNG
mgnify:CR=1 FL=1